MGDGVVAAEPQDLPLLQHAQQAALERERDVADLVEEDGPGVRRLEEPRPPAALRAGERAFLVAEELGLEERVRERRAVDRDERMVAAPARVVDPLREQLLAGAALSRDEHRRVRPGVVLRELLHAGDRPRPPTMPDSTCAPRSAAGGAPIAGPVHRWIARGSWHVSTAPTCTPCSRSGTRLTTSVRPPSLWTTPSSRPRSRARAQAQARREPRTAACPMTAAGLTPRSRSTARFAEWIRSSMPTATTAGSM